MCHISDSSCCHPSLLPSLSGTRGQRGRGGATSCLPSRAGSGLSGHQEPVCTALPGPPSLAWILKRPKLLPKSYSKSLLASFVHSGNPCKPGIIRSETKFVFSVILGKTPYYQLSVGSVWIILHPQTSQIYSYLLFFFSHWSVRPDVFTVMPFLAARDLLRNFSSITHEAPLIQRSKSCPAGCSSLFFSFFFLFGKSLEDTRYKFMSPPE